MLLTAVDETGFELKHNEQGRFQKKIKGSSSVSVAVMPVPSCYRVKRRGGLATGF